MKLFMCFGGAARVADDEAAAEEAARRGGKRAGRRRLLPSFRWKCFFPGKQLQGKNKKKRPSSSPPPPPPAADAKKRGADMDDCGGGGRRVFGAFTASSSSSSSLYSYSHSYYSSSPSATPARSSTGSCSCSPMASGALSPAPLTRRDAKGSSSTLTSPAAGLAAMVLCLLLVVFCGRVGATLLTPTVLYLFPRRWPAKAHRNEESLGSLQCDAEETPSQRWQG